MFIAVLRILTLIEKCWKVTFCFLIFQFDIDDPDTPYPININRDGSDEGLPFGGLPGVSQITITVTNAEGYTSVTISDLFVRACYEIGKYFYNIIL